MTINNDMTQLQPRWWVADDNVSVEDDNGQRMSPK